jgi:hypothetical protein
MKAELNLILTCVKTFLSASQASELSSALSEPLDWSAIEKYSDNHAVMPLVAHALLQHGTGLVPPNVCSRLQNRLLLAARQNLAWVREWLNLLGVLNDAGIPVISFKGPALSLIAYGNLSLREFTDLDLLVRPRDVVKARALLARNGYALDSPVADQSDKALTRSHNRQISFVKQAQSAAQVDLHWGLSQEESCFLFEVDDLFRAAIIESHQQITFLSLSPEHLLLLLCAHGTKHCWSNLRWVTDIACQLQSRPGLDWDLCVRLSESSDADLVFKHSLLLADRLLGARLPQALSDDIRGDREAHLLATQAQRFLFRDNEQGSPYLDDRTRYLEVLRYRLRLEKRGRWRHAAALVLRRVFVPNEADWRHFQLPRRLYFLHYLLRPVRLVIERLQPRHNAPQ